MATRLRGASIAVFHKNAVLLVRRVKPPLAGLWSLPGGKLEPGEPAERTALREVREETGIEPRIAGRLGIHTARFDVADGPGPPATGTIEIDVFYATAPAPRLPVAADDAAEARWVPLEELSGYHLTEGALDLILEAAALLAEKTA